MTQEYLQDKYKNQKVMGVQWDIPYDSLREGFTCRKDAMVSIDGMIHPLANVILRNLIPMPRWQAEQDASFKQIIPYAIIQNNETGMTQTTRRKGEDGLLVAPHRIGIGSHIEDGESVMDAQYRKIGEVTGLTSDDFTDMAFAGFLSSDRADGDQVHIGMVYRLYTDLSEIVDIEPDRLCGQWMSKWMLGEMKDAGLLENWGALLVDTL